MEEFVPVEDNVYWLLHIATDKQFEEGLRLMRLPTQSKRYLRSRRCARKA